ncbi:transglycosylase [Roseibium hamelinense]|nr:MltA domain-containing protein [Roseibium hamelinense]MTI44343.1 transglycosylase [Roseibium hamelinense]
MLADLQQDAREITFGQLAGWDLDDHQAALIVLQHLCANPATGTGRSIKKEVCAALDEKRPAESAKTFFERAFQPFQLKQSGFLTGYFEPELPASRRSTDRFSYPLYRAPENLIRIDESTRPPGWQEPLTHGMRTTKGVVEAPDRGQIMDGALDGLGLELVWLDDPIDAFFVHVQGSARLRLHDGGVMRVGYAGKTGHPYRSIARVLVERGAGTPEQLTMSGLRAWLERHPEERDRLFRENRSHIFFREVILASPDEGPIGSAGVPLHAGRSLAVDPQHYPLGLPVFLSSDLQAIGNGRPFSRLVMALDTGSAIKGAGRGDLFVGSGDQAGAIAGEIRHPSVFTVLVPRSLLQKSSGQ